MRRHGVTEVIHFAASVVAPRSVTEPLLYYRNNVGCADRPGRGLRRRRRHPAGVLLHGGGLWRRRRAPRRESAATLPVSPYGQSKLMAETILRDVTAATDLRAVVLRYFNVAGADPDGRAGQGGSGATHLMKVGVRVRRRTPRLPGDPRRRLAHRRRHRRPRLRPRRRYRASPPAGSRPSCAGHAAAAAFSLFNLGSGRGFSVREVVAGGERQRRARRCRRSSDRRRDGDVAEMVADTRRARDVLGWTPRFTLSDIAEHALAWERRDARQPLDA